MLLKTFSQRIGSESIPLHNACYFQPGLVLDTLPKYPKIISHDINTPQVNGIWSSPRVGNKDTQAKET